MENELYHLDSCSGDILCVYDDHIVIKHKGLRNFLTMGIKGDKTIYYTDIAAIEYKKVGRILVGYIQFTIYGGKENTGGIRSAVCDENTITLGDNKNSKLADMIVEFINKKIQNIKNTKDSLAKASAAEEIEKYKKLLDIDAITKEEYEKKKKELLTI